MKLCKVVKPGLFTSVQDLGRYGFQRYGVPVSGAMDVYAFAAANFLVGNNLKEACLEMTLLGPELKFLNDAQIAVTGAAVAPTVNREPVGCWQTVQVRKSDALSFGASQNGCRAYLATRGGINVPSVLNSRSTYTRGRFGGFKGRQLKAGDVIEQEPNTLLKSGLSVPEKLIPRYNNKLTIEVVLGPQIEYFTDRGLDTFLSSIFTVTTESDRMGYRLGGTEVERKGALNIVSDSIPIGAVQVPGNGRPIIVMRDAQTTGGYPKIAVVTTPDVSRLGQAKPNDKIRFLKISPSKARAKLLEYMQTLGRLKSRLIESKL